MQWGQWHSLRPAHLGSRGRPLYQGGFRPVRNYCLPNYILSSLKISCGEPRFPLGLCPPHQVPSSYAAEWGRLLSLLSLCLLWSFLFLPQPICFISYLPWNAVQRNPWQRDRKLLQQLIWSHWLAAFDAPGSYYVWGLGSRNFGRRPKMFAVTYHFLYLLCSLLFILHWKALSWVHSKCWSTGFSFLCRGWNCSPRAVLMIEGSQELLIIGVMVCGGPRQ